MDLILGGMFIFVVIAMIIAFVASILVIIARWNIFKKAGYQGWESIIPFYGDYVMCDIVFGKGFYFLILAIPSILAAYQRANESEESALVSFLTFVAAVFSMVMYYRLAGVFNRSPGFGVGLALLTPIFLMILAFDRSAFYNGPSSKAPVKMGMNFGNAGSYGNTGSYGGYNDYQTYGGNNYPNYPNNGFDGQNFNQQQDFQNYQNNGYQNNGFQNNGFQAQGQPLNNPFEKPNNENYYGNNSDYNNYNNQNGGNNNGNF